MQWRSTAGLSSLPEVLRGIAPVRLEVVSGRPRMSRVLCVTFVMLTLLSNPSSLQAQQCTQGTNDNAPPDPLDAYTWSNDFIALTRLGNHHMPLYGNGDSMTEPFWLNGGTTQPFGSDGVRDTWYIPRDNLAGTAPFYRLLGGADHMDSDNPNEASSIGYSMEFMLGRPWTTQKPGTKALSRYLNSSVFEHRTWLNSQTPSGYTVSARWDGVNIPGRFGYERHGNKLQWCDVETVAYTNNSISNTKLKIEFHKLWGNAIGRITWKPTNTQLVREQIGAMVQSTIFNTVNGVCCDYNPTQSGGVDLKNYGNTRRWAGSPIISESKTATTHVTELKPFNFSFNEWTGTDPWSPLVWKGTFKKTTTLGLNIAGTIYQDVFLMRFEAKRDDANVKANDHNMNNTYWLTMNPLGDGNVPNNFRIDMVNLDSGATQTLAHPAGRFTTSNNTISTPMDGRGVMLSKTDGTFAMGFHNPNGPQAYHVMYWCDGGAVTNGNCDSVFQTIVFNSFHNQTLGTTYDATKREDTYMIVGTRTDVIRRLRQIKCSLNGGGASCNSL